VSERDPIQKAHEALSEACRDGFRLRASIPANPDQDHDLLISRGLMWASERIAALEAERDEKAQRIQNVRAICRKHFETDHGEIDPRTILSCLLSEIVLALLSSEEAKQTEEGGAN
jgi:hypothetical protein